MRLDYRILWFDDQAQAISPFVERVKSIISRLGFEPMIDLRIVSPGNNDPLKDLPAQHEVDLVLMDWKLGGGHDGASLTRRVRHSFQDTDLVFYSSESAVKLRKLIFEQGVDGVFCTSRTNLSERASGIIHAQLRRTLDLNHMRGIVMAATSDLDHGMTECLEVVQKIAYPRNADDFAEAIAAKILKYLRKKTNDIEALAESKKLTKLLQEPSFGSSLRLEFLQQEVNKLADRLAERHIIEGLGSYQKEVITPRNDFAHRKAEVKDGKLILAGRETPLDQESMKDLRLRLLKHSDNLRSLLTLLSEMAEASGEQDLAEKIANVETIIAKTAEAIVAPTDQRQSNSQHNDKDNA